MLSNDVNLPCYNGKYSISASSYEQDSDQEENKDLLKVDDHLENVQSSGV
jgi:hypothetical protein